MFQCFHTACDHSPSSVLQMAVIYCWDPICLCDWFPGKSWMCLYLYLVVVMPWVMFPGPELLTVAGGGAVEGKALNNLAVAAASSSSLKCHMLCCFLVNFFMTVPLHYLVFGKTPLVPALWELWPTAQIPSRRLGMEASCGCWGLGCTRSSTSVSQLKAHTKSPSGLKKNVML